MENNSLKACFSGFLPTSGKTPILKFENALSLEEILKENPDEYGGVLKKDVILIDIDDFEQSERLMDIVEDLQLNCVIVETKRGKHFYFADSGIFKSNCTNKQLAIGLRADVKRGSVKSMGLLKYQGKERQCIWEYTPLAPAPAFLTPVNSKIDLWQLDNGGRNDSLYRYILTLEKAGLNRVDIKQTIELINKFILKSPLSKSELQTILREESFTKKEVDAPEINSAYELMQLDLKPIDFIVKDLLPVGLNILASQPKMGKSYMALDLSLSVASGTYFLGNETKSSTVYYLALEDSKNRLQNRIKQLLGDNSPSKDFYFALNINDLSNGLIEQLEQVLKALPDCKLIIIDTLQYIRGVRGKTDGVYDYDYNTMKQLKKFADTHELCILVIHHTRKDSNPYDPFANISGTNGISGACDTMLVLTKENRSSNQAKLSITGRDVDQRDLILTMTDCKWICKGNAEDIKKHDEELNFRADPFFNTINSLLIANGGKWDGTCQEIIDNASKLGYALLDSKGEPRTAKSLGIVLKNYDSNLTTIGGIKHVVVKDRGSGGARHYYSFIEN